MSQVLLNEMVVVACQYTFKYLESKQANELSLLPIMSLQFPSYQEVG